MKKKPAFIPSSQVSRYRSVFRSVFRPVFTERLGTKVKYRCGDCDAGFLWLNDFMNHLKEKHPGKRPSRIGYVT